MKSRYSLASEKAERFVKNVRRCRIAKHLSQRQLANILKVSVACISDMETHKHLPGFATVLMLADEFGMSIDELCNTEEMLFDGAEGTKSGFKEVG